MDKALTVEQVADRYGYHAGFVREACERDSRHHPLPHIRRGDSRPIRYIQPSTFEEWLAEEERITVGLDEAPVLHPLPFFQESMDALEELMESVRA